MGALSLHFGSTADVLTMVPSALRTAIAYAFGVRIITPSMTAWPPTIRSLSLVLMILSPTGSIGRIGTYRNSITAMPAICCWLPRFDALRQPASNGAGISYLAYG